MQNKPHNINTTGGGDDWIYLRGMRLECRIGVSAQERRKKQTITADIGLKCPLRCAGLSDRLEDTVDYAALAANINALARKKTWRLLEALAEDIAALCLAGKGIREVTVQAAKARPVPGLAMAEVAIRRRPGRKIK
ncbi:MAG: dihydroneopterin aldolase [Kiritimatiellia bacterium]